MRIFRLASLLLLSAFSTFAETIHPFHNDIEILSSSTTGLVLEIHVPDPRITTSDIKNVPGTILSINGYSSTNDPGNPMLLVRGIPIALPTGAQPSLRILQIEEKTQMVGELVPSPTFVTESQIPGSASLLRYEQGEAAYRSNRLVPDNNLTIGPVSTMRDVNIASILFHPIRYNAVSGTIKHVSKIRFAVDFNISPAAQHPAIAGQTSAFQTLFAKSLINYEQAKTWSSSQRRLAKVSSYFLQEGVEWFKISTDKAGLYTFSVQDLIDAGFDPGKMSLEKMRLFNMGDEVAIRVVMPQDSSVTENTVIEFYAQPFKNDYTTHNVYWLTVSEQVGKRMQRVDGTPTGDAPVLSYGRAEVLREKDVFHVANFPGHTDQEHWFMDSLFAPASKKYQLDLGKIARETNSNAALAFKMLGFAANVNIQPDHHTLVEINGEPVFDKFWDGRIAVAESVTFDHSVLKDDVNEIGIIAPGDTENSWLDWQLVDAFTLSYDRENFTESDSLAFQIERNGTYTIEASGFSASRVHIYDISDPRHPKLVDGAEQVSDTLHFEYTTSRSHFLLLSDAKKNHPLNIEKDAHSNWRALHQPVDYIIISYDEFAQDLAPLANFHQANGMAVQTLKIQDIYDEFGYGIYGKQPIKDFLSYAYENWQRPEFVLFVGDASWNPRRLRPELSSYGGGDRTDFVPTRLFEANVDNMQATSDSWFACFDGEDDVLPEMLVGRLPARSRIETQFMVQKLLNYATRFEAGDWQNTATFVADIGQGGSNAFEDSSDAYIKKYIPSDFSTNRIYLVDLGMPQTKEKIYQAFGDGCLTLNYFGHGAVHLWSKQTIFSNADVPNLDENINLPFVFTMSCINGNFADPNANASSLGERLVTADNKGALAVFTGSGKAFSSTLQPLTNGLYHSLYTENNPYVGVFSNAGLVQMHSTFPHSTDHVQFYVLFGDPASRLHYTTAGDARQYAWYSGTVDYKGAPPPSQSQLDAFIGDIKFSHLLINSSDGAFGPLYLPADDPATPEKDGGAEGDSVKFKLTLLDSTVFDLLPSVLWNRGAIDNLNLFVKGSGVATLYEVDFYVDQYKVGEQFFDGDPIRSSATIFAKVRNAGPSATRSDFDVLINGDKIENERLTVSYNSAAQNLILSFEPHSLRDGEYELKVRAHGSAAVADDSNSFRFRISSTLQVLDIVNFPNPFADNTRFTFMLHNDTAAEISIKIYTVSGRLIQQLNSYADVGYNELSWDGRDAYGDKLANGVYFYKIIANEGDERVERIERLVVMQ